MVSIATNVSTGSITCYLEERKGGEKKCYLCPDMAERHTEILAGGGDGYVRKQG